MLSDPQEYYCQVWSYLASHSQVLIRASKNRSEAQDAIYFLFTGVFYFDGPTQWQGAELETGTPDKFLEVLRQRKELDEIPDDHLLAKLHLYEFRMSNWHFKVKIIASEATQLNSLPADFSWLIHSDK